MFINFKAVNIYMSIWYDNIKSKTVRCSGGSTPTANPPDLQNLLSLPVKR